MRVAAGDDGILLHEVGKVLCAHIELEPLELFRDLQVHGHAPRGVVGLAVELMDGRENNAVLADAKVVAGALYREVIGVFSDGRLVFKDRPGVADRFSMRKVVRIIRGGVD